MHLHRTGRLGALAFVVLAISAVGIAVAVAKPSLGGGGGLAISPSGQAEQGGAANFLDPDATSPELGSGGGSAPSPTAVPVPTSAPARVATPPPPVIYWVADCRPNWIGFIDASRSITIVRPDGQCGTRASGS